ncbi:flagellar protein FlgN [Thermospira aquatica]|uniref:Flagellar protein FlgN n=1 Tax=Thermospira aquatica TaxID=2828656 RepID=A0AAX3BA49_9SPIR|nr:flagellar protein FlgN [Thermospira aquatica]URA09128.1 flagellar protein FlgN [Thermospira aquatica]
MDTVMAKLVEDIMKVLSEEAKLLQKILLLEEKKYQALKDVNLEQLMSINDQEELLLQHIHQEEQKRENLFSELQKKNSFRDFSDLLNQIEDDTIRNELSNIYIQLATLRDRIKMQSEENKHLIQLNSEIIAMTLGLFQKTHGETYHAPQTSTKPPTSGSFLINHVV